MPPLPNRPVAALLAATLARLTPPATTTARITTAAAMAPLSRTPAGTAASGP